MSKRNKESEKNTKDTKQSFEIPKRNPNRDPAEYDFGTNFIDLYVYKPFLGAICSKIVRVEDWTIPTAYMGFDRTNMTFVLGYNPEFMASLKNKSVRQWVIEHEIYHFIFGHVSGRSNSDPRTRSLFNIAADLAINSLLGKENMFENALMPGVMPKNCLDEEAGKLIASFKPLQSTEYYFEELKKFAENRQKDEGEGEGELTINIGNPNGETFDSHSWAEIPDDLKEIMNEKLKDIVLEGVKKSQMKGSWGNIPQSVQEHIEKLLTNEIDWKSILKWFIGKSRSMEQESTIKKINKKAPYLFPGRVRKTKAKLGFFIDQSGSMSDHDVQMALAAAFECSKETEIDVFNFDTEVDESSFQTWKRNSTIQWKRTRSGGTDFNAVRKFALKQENKKRWTGIAIVTDGEAPEMGTLPGIRVIWLITENGTAESVRKGDLVVKMKEDRIAKIKM